MPKASDSILIQERDIAILRGLFESRVMTRNHIAVLFFDGRTDAAAKRLQKLKSAGLVSERPRKAFEPAVLSLTRRGLAPLSDRGILSEYPAFTLPALERRASVSELTLRHELEVMDVKAAFHSALHAVPAFRIAEFNTWPLLNEFTVSHPSQGEVTVRPDGFLRLHETHGDGSVYEHSFFFELDRSTETLNVLVTRAQSYLAYYRSGGFAERNGADRAAFRDYPFRALFVFKTAERRNNAGLRLAESNPPVLSQVWLTTISEIATKPFGEIWTRPVDLRDSLAGTPFAESAAPSSPSYRRTFRESFLEPRLKKLSLMSAQ